jgi:hypothetical protein
MLLSWPATPKLGKLDAYRKSTGKRCLEYTLKRSLPHLLILLLLAACNLPAPQLDPSSAIQSAVPGANIPGARGIDASELTEPAPATEAVTLQPADTEAAQVTAEAPSAENGDPPEVNVEKEEAQPSPTATIVPESAAQCGELSKDPNFPRFGRLMHDSQWMDWPSRMGAPDWPNGYNGDWYPETVQLWTNPRSGDGRIAYSKEWLQYLRDLQPNSDAAVWITRIAAGLFNRGNEFIPILDLDQLKDNPVAESISSGGNVVYILESRNGSGRIEMLYFKKWPPDVNAINYQTRPWLITKFTSVSRDGELGNAGGIDVYFPNLAKDKDGYWVDRKRVELFPRLPFCATASTSLGVFNDPSLSASQVSSIGAGQFLPIIAYMPQGSDVWGHTGLGWVLLEYQSQGRPVYTTSWSMETRPPIDFD